MPPEATTVNVGGRNGERWRTPENDISAKFLPSHFVTVSEAIFLLCKVLEKSRAMA
jgi:hypothetical protein